MQYSNILYCPPLVVTCHDHEYYDVFGKCLNCEYCFGGTNATCCGGTIRFVHVGLGVDGQGVFKAN